MITALLILIGLAMIAGGFWSMSRHEGIDGRFTPRLQPFIWALRVIAAAIVRAII